MHLQRKIEKKNRKMKRRKLKDRKRMKKKELSASKGWFKLCKQNEKCLIAGQISGSLNRDKGGGG